MKKILSILLVLVMLLSVVSCADNTADDKDAGENDGDDTQNDNENDEDSEDEGKAIDIYIIAGQSNAVGCTRIVNPTPLYRTDARLKNGFSNVHYAGNSRGDSSNYTVLVNNEQEWQNVKLGLGRTENHMGPEAGMAVALSEYYNEETGKNAGIIKLAHGGTNLLDRRTGSSSFGNWVSPSYAAELNVSYNDSDITGGLYRALLAQLEKNIGQLHDYGGYTKVNIMGIYWMQGEADRGNFPEYEKAFKLFAKDIRNDVADLMLEITDGKSDCGASDMPILIGTLSNTYNLTSSSTEKQINRPFINMQKRLANSIDNCYIVDNSDFAMGEWDSVNNKVTILGSDQHHWNQDDMLAIGQNVGEKFLEISDRK